MRNKLFISASGVAGLASFYIFCLLTAPLEVALDWLLLVAFIGSGLLSAFVFTLLWRRISRRWIRLSIVPFYLSAFALFSGLGVFGVSNLIFYSRPRSPDSGCLLYGDTSGMHMISWNGDLWFHVVGCVIVPCLLLAGIGAIAAYKGFRDVPDEKNA